MNEINLKDRMILYHLQLNSRQSFKTIGKKVGMSSELVSYRIRRLKEKKIIKNFTILMNWEKLGYSVMSIFYKFININKNVKEEILNFLVNSKNTGYVSLIEGIYNLQVDFLIGNPFEFESLIDELRKKYYKFLSYETSFFYIKGEFYDYAFLLKDYSNRPEPLYCPWGNKFTVIDDLDYRILSELSNNSRLPTKNIANRLNSTINIVNYRIKKLIKDDIIRHFTINVDWQKIGYRFFHLQIGLGDYTKKDQIINYLRKNPYMIKRFKMLTLDMDLHFTFLLQSMEQLRDLIEDISLKYPNIINDYRFYSTYKIYKAKYMIPKILQLKNPLHKGDFI